MNERELLAGIADPWWRLCNLYWIVNEDGKPVPFTPNEEQTFFYQNIWYRNLILKARQLGFSTLLELMAFDQTMFNANFTSNIIADTLPNAGKLFRKVTMAYDRLPDLVKETSPVRGRTNSELVFENGSSISVGTSARGGTVQFLHVSEMGKIAKKHPEKAREIVTGAFEAVPASGIITVESTAEGNGGEFYDLCEAAEKKALEKLPLTPLEFKLHFFPWHKKAAYRLDPTGQTIPADKEKYFREVTTKLGFNLDDAQKVWYIKKEEILKRDMRREYPASPTEAFEQAVEGAIYGQEMATLRERGRITDVPVDPYSKVNTFWDMGASDHTAIWLHQRVGLANRFVRYFEGTHTGLRAWWKELEDWLQANQVEAGWGTHFLPHDANAVMQGVEIESQKKLLEGLGAKNVQIVDRVNDLATGIDKTRDAMVRDVWMDRTHCAGGIKCLDNYQFEWDDKRGMWKSEPLHNWASHGSDAFRQWAQGYRAPGEVDADRRRKRDRNWRTA